MRAMSASRDKSVGEGRTSHPVAGGVRSQILLSSTISSVMSKFLVDTEDLLAGYSFFH